MRRDDPVAVNLKKRASAAYIKTGAYLQKKLPLNNKVWRHISALDPAAHGHSSAVKAMKKLQTEIPCGHTADNRDQFDQDVHRFHVDENLLDTDKRLDVWWGEVHKSHKYPALSKLALAACTIFHGPLVEASFNTMGDIIDIRSTSMSIKTYLSMQTVKYYLKTRNVSAISLFSRDDTLYSPVDPILCVKMKTASVRYRNELKEKKEEQREKTVLLRLPERTSPKKLRHL